MGGGPHRGAGLVLAPLARGPAPLRPPGRARPAARRRRVRHPPPRAQHRPRRPRLVVVVGDVHGQLHDVIFLLQDAGFPSEERIFVFNGDYVDRGAWGLETLLLLLAWKVLLQKSVFLLRGNHESKYCTSVYGFEQRSKERGHQKSDIGAQLPNRLGKMLAPLHWHDYKKHYGKLDDFVAIHPELFVIEGDFIHLCEGAQQIISATTAAAKIAAASSAPYSSLLPSVAVTPVAQSTRQKRVPVVDSRSSNTMPSGNGSTTTNFGDQFDKCSHIPKAGDPHQSFNIVHGISDVTVSNKVKDTQENGFSDEVRPGQSSMHTLAANGGRNERAGLPMHDKGVSNIRHGYGGKQQGRSIGTTYISRR